MVKETNVKDNMEKFRDYLLLMKSFFPDLPDIELIFKNLSYKTEGKLKHVDYHVENEDMSWVKKTPIEMYISKFDEIHKENLEYIADFNVKKQNDKFEFLKNICENYRLLMELVQEDFGENEDIDQDDNEIKFPKIDYFYSDNISDGIHLQNNKSQINFLQESFKIYFNI